MTSPVLSKTTVTIPDMANGISKSKQLTVNPAMTVSPTSLKFGAVAIAVNSITLTGTYDRDECDEHAAERVAVGNGAVNPRIDRL